MSAGNGDMPEPGSIESNRAHMAARAARNYKAHMESAEKAADPKHYLALAVRELQVILRYSDAEGRKLAANELRGHQVAELLRQVDLVLETMEEETGLYLDLEPGTNGDIARRLFKKLPDAERWDKLPPEVELSPG